MAQDAPPVSLEEVETLTTWEEAWAFSQRGILEQRQIKQDMPTLETEMINARTAWQSANDRMAELSKIMQALMKRGPDLQ